MRNQLILLIDENDESLNRFAKQFEIKWKSKDRSLNAHQIISISSVNSHNLKNEIDKNTRIILLGHAYPLKRKDIFFKLQSNITVDTVAEKIKLLINEKVAGTFLNPVVINLVMCFGGYARNGESSIAENLYYALLSRKISSKITARETSILACPDGRKKTLPIQIQNEIIEKTKKYNDSCVLSPNRARLFFEIAWLDRDKNYGHHLAHSKYTLFSTADTDGKIVIKKEYYEPTVNGHHPF